MFSSDAAYTAWRSTQSIHTNDIVDILDFVAVFCQISAAEFGLLYQEYRKFFDLHIVVKLNSNISQSVEDSKNCVEVMLFHNTNCSLVRELFILLLVCKTTESSRIVKLQMTGCRGV